MIGWFEGGYMFGGLGEGMLDRDRVRLGFRTLSILLFGFEEMCPHWVVVWFLQHGVLESTYMYTGCKEIRIEHYTLSPQLT